MEACSSRPDTDDRTGLLFDPLGIRFPHVPDRPTRDDALNALALLKDLIGSFHSSMIGTAPSPCRQS
jgi:hypothetical protein